MILFKGWTVYMAKNDEKYNCKTKLQFQITEPLKQQITNLCLECTEMCFSTVTSVMRMPILVTFYCIEKKKKQKRRALMKQINKRMNVL